MVNLQTLLNHHQQVKETHLSGRYITSSMILPLLKNLGGVVRVRALGTSVGGELIHSVSFGSGPTKILMWSQMHGNESTSTKSLFDLYNIVISKTMLSQQLLENYTIETIPMLNPDGARAYTRVNQNGVDLNRDAVALSQPESKILRTCYEEFQPDYCFNLHGQRTIYGFEASGKPSILSFLTPSSDEGRTVTLSRKRSMSIVSAIAGTLQSDLDGCIGRYDDGYNLQCTGDYFQTQGTPTVLFEAGHFPNDYEREVTRQYMFAALVTGILATQLYNEETAYFDIPEHQKCFCDVLLKRVVTAEGTYYRDIAILFEEQLDHGKISFVPKIIGVNYTSPIYGHATLDLKSVQCPQLTDAMMGIDLPLDTAVLNTIATITL